ncbi:MAG: RloB family protein [Bifidobacteriaceae bacterium]|jgi:hypothetical protein|nr:RloB family protein [Bifidobacteriaceae bacterium]
MSAKRTRAKDLRRRIGHSPELRTLVVFCEGEGSEPDYIRGLQRLPQVAGNTALTIEISTKHGVPLTLVDLAVKKLKDPEIDECWCVFDVEWPRHHPGLAEALARARGAGVQVAVSNPCFELWLILHYKECSAFLNTDQAERKSRSLDRREGKRVSAASYMSRIGDAVRRAEALDRRHEGNGTVFPENNPSSGMYLFIRAVGADKTPAPGSDG